MSEYDRHCPDCGGDGFHYSDCIYDGTEGPGGNPTGYRGGSDVSTGKVWLFYIVALIIGYGINELLGAVLLIGMIFWLCVCR